MTFRIFLLATLALCSCADETESFELSFPSVEAFVASETARVFAVPLNDARGACRDLLFSVESVGPLGDDASTDTGPIPVCEFRGGGVELPSVESGLVAYVATTTDTDGNVLLSGCTLRDVYTDADGVVITLSPTDAYRERIGQAGYVPVGCSVEARCSGACR